MSKTVSCDNCGWTGSFDDVNDILDFEERMSCPEGGIAIMPAGECPECGCLAYYDQDSRDWPVHLKALDLLKALQAVLARINGEWDHPALVAFGPLRTDPMEDIRYIVEEVLK